MGIQCSMFTGQEEPDYAHPLTESCSLTNSYFKNLAKYPPPPNAIIHGALFKKEKYFLQKCDTAWKYHGSSVFLSLSGNHPVNQLNRAATAVLCSLIGRVRHWLGACTKAEQKKGTTGRVSADKVWLLFQKQFYWLPALSMYQNAKHSRHLLLNWISRFKGMSSGYWICSMCISIYYPPLFAQRLGGTHGGVQPSLANCSWNPVPTEGTFAVGLSHWSGLAVWHDRKPSILRKQLHEKQKQTNTKFPERENLLFRGG